MRFRRAAALRRLICLGNPEGRNSYRSQVCLVDPGRRDGTLLLQPSSRKDAEGFCLEAFVDITTLLIILVVIVVLGGGGFYGRRRWF
jgi:hypothetical protein